jgi:hypothetical protein
MNDSAEEAKELTREVMEMLEELEIFRTSNPISCRARMTPMCACPRAPPLPSTSETVFESWFIEGL